MHSQYRGLIIVLALSLFPAAVLLVSQPIVDLFGSLPIIFNTFGKITGLVGLSLFSLNFVYTARWKILEKILGPLDQQYRSHHISGGLALIFLLIHPTLLTLQFVPISISAAYDFLLDFSTPLLLGKLALAGLLGILILTFYVRWKKYENWRAYHQWLGLFLVLGGLHAFLMPSDVSRLISLKIIIFSYLSLGLVAYLWRTVIKGWRWSRYRLTVETVTKITDQITEVVLKPQGSFKQFLPGQFAFVEFAVPGLIGQPHPFSISSDPQEDKVRFSIKSLGDFTQAVQSLPVGSQAFIEGPFGGFSYLEVFGKKQIWIAGGIGITPFLAMARHFERTNNKDHEIDLFYSVKNESESSFFDELRLIANRHKNFRFHGHLADDSGFLTVEKIIQSVADLDKSEIFLCGPPSFMNSLRAQFTNKGVLQSKIHFEVFSLK